MLCLASTINNYKVGDENKLLILFHIRSFFLSVHLSKPTEAILGIQEYRAFIKVALVSNYSFQLGSKPLAGLHKDSDTQKC